MPKNIQETFNKIIEFCIEDQIDFEEYITEYTEKSRGRIRETKFRHLVTEVLEI